MIKQRQGFTPAQISAILGLEAIIHATGLTLICTRCLADGFRGLDTDNDPNAAEFKIDCQCRERRVNAADVGRAMDADGDLIAHADEMLRPLSLSVRCPDRRCITHPLEIEHTPEGTIIRCHCAKTTLRLLPSLVH